MSGPMLGRLRRMELTMVGLGRMGAGLSRRLMAAGHRVVALDVDAAAVDALARDGAVGVHSHAELVKAMTPPRAVWLMVPAAYTQSTLDDLAALLEPGDAIIDGGNSDWRDDIAAPRSSNPSSCTTWISARAVACSASNAASA